MAGKEYIYKSLWAPKWAMEWANKSFSCHHVIDNEFEVCAWGCELTSLWPAVVTVEISASIPALAVLKPERLKSPLDFNNENPSLPMTEGKGTKDQAHERVAPEILPPGNMPTTRAASGVSLEEEVTAVGPYFSKKCRKRVNDGAVANATPKVLRKDYASVCPEQSTREGKSLPTIGLAADSTFVTPADTKGVGDPNPLSNAEPQPHPEQSMTQSFDISTGNVATIEVQDMHSAETERHALCEKCRVREIDLLPIYGWVTQRYLSARMGHDQQLPPGHPGRMPIGCRSHSATGVAMGSQLRLRFKQEVRLLKKARAQIARGDQRIQAEANMKKATKAKNAYLTKELKSLHTQFLDLQIRAAFEEFKKDEDDRMEKHCAEMYAYLDALSIDFNEELYPHMLTVITGRRWVIGHGLRLAVMKCAESIKPRAERSEVPNSGSAGGFKGCPNGGLVILLADAATQTETSEDDASPSLLRSKSLPPMYNLDWP
uniref:Transposase (Putative), gypsy type n=1 Tax=Tanacetum cinerariifolium TaxID=118510 RepID=A0A699H9D2_TANCI|nr:hypothetical protein [Tanacetum cinerariifolium]